MATFDRLPALPLIANDPYFSVWLPADLPTGANTVHWTGAEKWLRCFVTVDGVSYRLLGKNGMRAAQTTGVKVTPTQTIFTEEAAGVEITLTFWTPALPDDLDTLSTPITFVDYAAKAIDGKTHEIGLHLLAPLSLCYDGGSQPEIHGDTFRMGDMNVYVAGQVNQKVLCHSADHVTIDWGYLYVTSPFMNMQVDPRMNVDACWNGTVAEETVRIHALLGYDDVASINYFGVPCRAWYSRNGRTIMDALCDFNARHDELHAACEALDKRVMADALEAGGEDYQLIAAAAWRHTFAAHKLIATPKGEMALLSKENDSNGCIGTVDVSYPTIPMFLKYCPELVNAMCRPVLEFASMPVWDKDFAPHDVGRYPYATGQVYALKTRPKPGLVTLPYYLYPAGADIYTDRGQMPVEESGNMLVMLDTAIAYGADDSLARAHMDKLETWVRYLDVYGEDPGEQLCTDDFAGHLAHNVNLSAKAVVGMACYARLLKHFGKPEEAEKWNARAHELADSWTRRTSGGEATPLTFDGQGWSMKYNLVWDIVLDLGLMDKDFYRRETESYLPRINEFGLPLDSRADYTKSDWICWTAAMAKGETRAALLKPIAHYLRNSQTRIPFGDWYDTKTGDYVAFIARSVQGGVYMPMLTVGK